MGVTFNGGVGAPSGSKFIVTNRDRRVPLPPPPPPPLDGQLAWALDNPNADGTTTTGDYFAFAVSNSNTYTTVGARYEDVGANASGSAYIFDNATGNLLWTLTNPSSDGVASDQFGGAVGCSETYSVVGAHYDYADGTKSGRAYIYDNATGNLLHTLSNPNAGGGTVSDEFGTSVNCSETYTVVSAPKDYKSADPFSGVVYIYDNATGNLLHTLINPSNYGPSSYDYFGSSVSISETHTIVGAYQEGSDDGINSGAVYIYDNATGNILHTIVNPSPAGTSAQDNFGYSVSCSETYSTVGAYFEDVGGTNSGTVYIYDNATGNLLWTLVNPNPVGTVVNDYFGGSVGCSETYTIAGARFEDDDNVQSGKVYIFDNATGVRLHTIDNPNTFGTTANDGFGQVVSISETNAVGGSWEEDDALGLASGKAYIFT